MKMITAVAAAAVLAGAAWADAQSEISQASKHARLAASAANLTEVRHHLQHALNCLVGPDGKGFSPAAENPCEGAGKGAILDTTDPTKRQELQAVADQMAKGIAATEEATAKQMATNASEMLQGE